MPPDWLMCYGSPMTAKRFIHGAAVHIRISPEMLDRLDLRAREAGCSRPEAIRRAIAEWCAREEAAAARRKRLEKNGR